MQEPAIKQRWESIQRSCKSGGRIPGIFRKYASDPTGLCCEVTFDEVERVVTVTVPATEVLTSPGLTPEAGIRQAYINAGLHIVMSPMPS